MGIDGNIWDSIIDYMDIIKLDFRSGDMGAFLEWGYPNSWIVYHGKSQTKWIIWGYLYFRKPPYIKLESNLI